MQKTTNEFGRAISSAYETITRFEEPDSVQIQARVVMDILCFNLRLEEIGKPGEAVIYDCFIHKDMHGGLCPGAHVVIVHSGWKHEGKTLVRAQVNYPEPHTCKWCSK